MPDVVDKQTRSRMMSGIRGTNTSPELQIRRLLHRNGFRFRLHDRKLPGKPDLVLRKYNAIIFVNGCFWHGHNCHLFKWPSTRAEWWRQKIDRTRLVDQTALAALQQSGWRIAIVWECALKGRTKLAETEIEQSLIQWLRTTDRTSLEIRDPFPTA